MPVPARVHSRRAGVAYRYEAFTHCGITPITFDFDGSFWRPLDDTAAEALVKDDRPPGEAPGTIELLNTRRAEFRYKEHVLQLERVDGAVAARLCE
jgi:hypothetical protein